MPIENELKFVLPPDFDADRLQGWARQEIRQGYLDDGPRIRQVGQDHLFTYKRWIEQVRELVEIETSISAEDFNLLWQTCSSLVHKTRYEKRFGGCEWSVDFLRDAQDRTYFVMAEAEMPRHQTTPGQFPEVLREHVVHSVAVNDVRFTNKKLSSVAHAMALYREVSGLRSS